MINLILCGGNGTRLWPISRTLMPKQFVRLFNEKSLFQLTLQRNAHVCDGACIVSSAEQYFLALDQQAELHLDLPSTFLLEPIGRNTAPAIALACMAYEHDTLMLVTPSDHLIQHNENYYHALERAKNIAQEGCLVTFGIVPTHPETGFGYIEADGEMVRAFHEKPDQKRAQAYLQKGNYFWNSGMFCFKAGVFLEELQRHAPKIYQACVCAFENAKKETIIRILHEHMAAIPEDSIDYAVMEKSQKVRVVAGVDLGWSDVGSFDALYEELPKDKQGNTKYDHYIGINSHSNFIYAEQKKIATIDVDDLIIVDTGDALLISKKGSSQKVKEVVNELKKRHTQLHNIHLTAYRPWGTYTILEENPSYKIKRIVVKPGKRLSLQKHFHRSEHWIVVSGTAIIQVSDVEKLVKTNESTYIPIGETHRLSNPGKIDLVLIEAQVGGYLGEDDIVRMEDDFERHQ